MILKKFQKNNKTLTLKPIKKKPQIQKKIKNGTNVKRLKKSSEISKNLKKISKILQFLKIFFDLPKKRK